MSLWRFMGGPISRWFCVVHPQEFLIFNWHKGRACKGALCPKCLRSAP